MFRANEERNQEWDQQQSPKPFWRAKTHGIANCQLPIANCATNWQLGVGRWTLSVGRFLLMAISSRSVAARVSRASIRQLQPARLPLDLLDYPFESIIG